MRQESIQTGVFLYDEPTIDRLKACSFFWKNIIVFESYLSDVVEKPDLVEPTKILFKEGILKICESAGNLRNAITDKIYYNLDKELWEYIYRHPEKVATKPDLPENAEQIIKESTERDYKDANLRSLMDKVIYNSIEQEWLNTLHNYDRIPFESMPSDMKKYMLSYVRKMTNLRYKQYLHGKSEIRFNFEYRNRYLLEQMSVSSCLYAPAAWLPYYSYKFGDYSVKDAKRYLNGLNAIMPFIKRESVESFSLEEIIVIRRNRRWNSAMTKLAELCNDIKYGASPNEFSKEIQDRVVSEYQNALDQEELTYKDLGKQLVKGSVFAGISLIPIIGGVVSAITGLVDPIVLYFQKEGVQKNLPFFLNDLRRIRK